MPITITSKKDGFRRAGMAHPAKPNTYPDGTFTAEQLKALQADPMLVVHVTAPEPEKPKDSGETTDEPAGKALADMTKKELAAWLAENKVAFPTSASKDELVALAEAKVAELAKGDAPAEGAE